MRKLGLSEHIKKEKLPGDSKSHLLEVFKTQEELIYTQNETIVSLLNENIEQENMINELMRGD